MYEYVEEYLAYRPNILQKLLVLGDLLKKSLMLPNGELFYNTKITPEGLELKPVRQQLSDGK